MTVVLETRKRAEFFLWLAHNTLFGQTRAVYLYSTSYWVNSVVITVLGFPSLCAPYLQLRHLQNCCRVLHSKASSHLIIEGSWIRWIALQLAMGDALYIWRLAIWRTLAGALYYIISRANIISLSISCAAFFRDWIWYLQLQALHLCIYRTKLHNC
jgi:hypothetical protein